MDSSTPADPERFCILVQALIGPAGGEGEESFDFTVCTPRWLSDALLKDRVIFGRHYLIVGNYSYDDIFDAIAGLCESIERKTWQEVAEHLGRYGKWEFEDYSSQHFKV